MSAKGGAAVFAFGMLIFGFALFAPTAITAASTDATTAVEIIENESETPQDNLEVEATAINTTNGNVTVEVTNLETYTSTTIQDLAPGQNRTVSLDGESVTIDHQSFTDPEVILSVTYPPTFSFSESEKLFYDNLGELLAAVGLITAVSGVFVGARGA